MPHLFIACLSTETNTFSPRPTKRDDYAAYCLHHGTATAAPPNLMTESLHLWRSNAEGLGWQVTESLTAIAEPAGLTTAETYAEFKAEILGDAASVQPDIVLLSLHGAMVAQGCEDCEGDLVSALRVAHPRATIGVLLDLHAHLTETLLNAADLVVTFKEYPHDDATPRAAELWELALKTHRGELAPTMAMADAHMVHLYLTKSGPMRAFVDQLSAMEGENGIPSVSLSHGFPWADVTDVGARILVIADKDLERAQSTADRLAREFFTKRHEVSREYPALTEALEQAALSSGPVVLADMADNSGAGAPGDATFVLQEILDRGLSRVASGLYFDPAAVAACIEAGNGAEITLSLGGKLEPASGNPVSVTGRIMAIRANCGQHLGPGLEPMGTAIWLRMHGEIDIVINDLRVQVYHPEAFTQLGIDLASKQLIVVKSTLHFYTPFAAIASEVIFCATPGRVAPAFETLALTKRQMPWWPRDRDPWRSG